MVMAKGMRAALAFLKRAAGIEMQKASLDHQGVTPRQADKFRLESGPLSTTLKRRKLRLVLSVTRAFLDSETCMTSG